MFLAEIGNIPTLRHFFFCGWWRRAAFLPNGSTKLADNVIISVSLLGPPRLFTIILECIDRAASFGGGFRKAFVIARDYCTPNHPSYIATLSYVEFHENLGPKRVSLPGVSLTATKALLPPDAYAVEPQPPPPSRYTLIPGQDTQGAPLSPTKPRR